MGQTSAIRYMSRVRSSGVFAFGRMSESVDSKEVTTSRTDSGARAVHHRGAGPRARSRAMPKAAKKPRSGPFARHSTVKPLTSPGPSPTVSGSQERAKSEGVPYPPGHTMTTTSTPVLAMRVSLVQNNLEERGDALQSQGA